MRNRCFGRWSDWLCTSLLVALGCVGSSQGVSAQESAAPRIPASLITAITVVTLEDGRTVIELVGNGTLATAGVGHLRLGGDKPREVLKVRGIQQAYRDPVIIVGDQNVRRIRTGFHDEGATPELHLVIDLVSEQVKLTRLVHEKDRLRLELTRAGASVGTAPQRSEVAGGTPVPEPTIEAWERPPTHGNVPNLPEQEQQADLRVADQTPTPPAPSPTAAPQPTPVPAGGPLIIEEVMILEQPYGCRVVIKADRPFAPYSVRELRFSGYPPRHALSIANAKLGTVPELIPVSSTTLRQLRLLVYEDRQPAEVQVLLELASGAITVSEVTRQGSTLSIDLRHGE